MCSTYYVLDSNGKGGVQREEERLNAKNFWDNEKAHD